MALVVVIGAGLTGLTTAYYLKKQGHQVTVIEKSHRAGGVIESHHEQGFTFESGPTTGVLSHPEAGELFAELSGLCRVDIANPDAKVRWIWKDNGWQALPSGLLSAIKTPLFTWGDKFRILGEPWRKPGTNPDESLADLVRRRMGRSFLDYAVNPFVAGVYAGDPERLVTRFALPKLYQLEQTYGSFVKGTIKKRKEPKAPNANLATREVFSFEGGLDRLVTALIEAIGRERVLTHCGEVAVSAVNEGSCRFRVTGARHQQPLDLSASHVVTTCGAGALPDLLPFVDRSRLQPFVDLYYVPMVQVVLGFQQWRGISLKAFGGLVPEREGRDVLGVLLPSSFLKQRAPQGGALMMVFMGGRRHPEVLSLTDEQVMERTAREVCAMMGLKAFDPDLVRIFRYQHAIPQYEADTGRRLAAVESIQSQYPGLVIGGNLRGGIGMADRIRQGRQMADAITAMGE